MKKNNSKSKWIIVAVFIAVLIPVSLYVYKSRQAPSTAPATTNNPEKEKLDLNPATKEDKARADANKEAIAKQQESQQSANSASKRTVTPVIVDASQYGDQIEVRSFVPGVVESGGACTITFTQGSLKLTKTVASTPDATTTQCAKLKFSRSELGVNGTVSVAVAYASTQSAGTSESRSMEIK